MKQRILLKLATFAVIGATAVSLTGCVPFWGMGHQIGREIGNDIRSDLENARDEIESALDDIDWGNYSSDHLDLSDLEGEFWEEKENKNDHRETTQFEIGDQTKVILNLGTSGNRNVIINQDSAESWEKTGSLQYDPSHFKVEQKLEGDTLTIKVDGVGEKSANPSYKCYVHLPSRIFEKITVNANSAGFAINALPSPVEIIAVDSGFALVNPTADVRLDATDCGFSATVNSSFSSRFDLTADNCGFSVQFSNGGPENLKFTLDSADSAIVIPSAWGKSMQKHVEYQTGNGSTEITMDVENSAASVNVN